MPRPHLLAALSGALFLAHVAGAPAASTAELRERLPQDEVVYFLLPDRFANGNPANDRGGLEGDRLTTGFDPTSRAFYHGGDLAGLTARLDYIQALGATAVWLAPIFKNKPVQGGRGQESAGYHGYWVTDFTRVDPHFGEEHDMRAFVEAAHARGMKVYLDIITNHTADVIAFRECVDQACPYRSQAEFPWTRRGGPDGAPINEGFQSIDGPVQTAENFARLTRPDFAYTPFVPQGEERVKVPAWLNDPLLYHNRGNTTFEGESGELGDFVGLDDLMTENPRVVAGMTEIFGSWIDRYRIDGFRIDTARHVNPEFWRAFVPAMQARAAKHGIRWFHIFGEVASSEVAVAPLARYARAAALPSVLDFALANAVRATVAGSAGTEVLARVFADDLLYEGGEAAALQLPTFVSNHDFGRFAGFVRVDRPDASDAEVLARVRLAHAMLFTLRGVPVVYYGDEQGFAGIGGDQSARHDMFATQVAEYAADRRLGVEAQAKRPDAFDVRHPLYMTIAELAALRTREAALRRGRQLVRFADPKPGLLVASRLDPLSGREIVVAFNTASEARSAVVEVASRSQRFVALHGACTPQALAPGSYGVRLEPLEFAVCAARE